jgi:hypothetical protein
MSLRIVSRFESLFVHEIQKSAFMFAPGPMTRFGLMLTNALDRANAAKANCCSKPYGAN